MTREYRGESEDEWMGITCPEDCAPLESNYDADADYEAYRDHAIESAMAEAVKPTPVTTEQIAARRAFVERTFAHFPDFEQRLAMLDAEAGQ